MSKAKGGIYTYIGNTDNNGTLNGTGILTYPSGNKVKGDFRNNHLQINARLAKKDNKLGKVIDCSLLTQEQFKQHIESLLKATTLNAGDTLSIKHHQLQLSQDTANTIATHLKDKNITTLQWLSCGGGDVNINQHIQIFNNQGIKVVAVKDGQSAITAKNENGAEYMVGVDKDGKPVLPEFHRLSILQFVQNNYHPYIKNPTLNVFFQLQQSDSAAKYLVDTTDNKQEQYQAISKLIYECDRWKEKWSNFWEFTDGGTDGGTNL